MSPVMEAIRYWEPRRIVYNLILTAITIAWLVGTWPHFRPAMTLDSLMKLVILGVIANVFYCAAYFPEIAMQEASSPVTRRRWRGAVFLVGTLFAILLTNYWIADEIYPSVG